MGQHYTHFEQGLQLSKFLLKSFWTKFHQSTINKEKELMNFWYNNLARALHS